MEIDEFQNYEKALGAMNEASRSLNKVTSPRDVNQHRRAMDIVQTRMANIKRFIDIKRLFERGDHAGGVTQSLNLLQKEGEELEQSVRRGDVYALMIQNAIKIGDINEARKYVNELQQILNKQGNSSLSYYLSKEIIDGLGISVSTSQNANKNNDDDEFDGEIEEEVEN